MGKRTVTLFERKARDYYPTPEKAVLPLLPHLPQHPFTFCEPCAGDGRLVRHIEKLSSGKCSLAIDIDPQAMGVLQRNALLLTPKDVVGVDLLISNPPWSIPLLHDMIRTFAELRPTWLLFYTDWLFTKQANPFLPHLRKVVAVGRVSWEENGVSGKDNAAWYLFDAAQEANTQFIGRAA